MWTGFNHSHLFWRWYAASSELNSLPKNVIRISWKKNEPTPAASSWLTVSPLYAQSYPYRVMWSSHSMIVHLVNVKLLVRLIGCSWTQNNICNWNSSSYCENEDAMWLVLALSNDQLTTSAFQFCGSAKFSENIFHLSHSFEQTPFVFMITHQFFCVFIILSQCFRVLLWWSNDVFITDFSHSIKIACAQIISLQRWNNEIKQQQQQQNYCINCRNESSHFLRFEKMHTYERRRAAAGSSLAGINVDRLDHATVCWRCRATNYRCKRVYKRLDMVVTVT